MGFPGVDAGTASADNEPSRTSRRWNFMSAVTVHTLWRRFIFLRLSAPAAHPPLDSRDRLPLAFRRSQSILKPCARRRALPAASFARTVSDARGQRVTFRARASLALSLPIEFIGGASGLGRRKARPSHSLFEVATRHTDRLADDPPVRPAQRGENFGIDFHMSLQRKRRRGSDPGRQGCGANVQKAPGLVRLVSDERKLFASIAECAHGDSHELTVLVGADVFTAPQTLIDRP